jgi:lactate dehydrogenase-like 2-hydroxyacid dehydrogenase
MQRKTLKKWETEPMELVSNKKMVILGYGDIGQGCAKTMKLGFGMKITGIKKNPLIFSEID